MTLLGDLVTAWRAVVESSSRSPNVATLAEALRRLDVSEVAAAVGLPARRSSAVESASVTRH